MVEKSAVVHYLALSINVDSKLKNQSLPAMKSTQTITQTIAVFCIFLFLLSLGVCGTTLEKHSVIPSTASPNSTK